MPFPDNPNEVNPHQFVKVTSDRLYDLLNKHGLIPEPGLTERIVIELKAGTLGRITYYNFADERLLKALGEAFEDDTDEQGTVDDAKSPGGDT